VTDKLHTFAEHDTPSEIRVPEGWPGIIAWMLGRFGVGAVFAAVCMWGMSRVYQDQRELTQQVLVSFNKQTEVTMRNSAAIDSLTRAVETLTRDQRDNERDRSKQQPVR
jgi:hypothetical protein